MAAAFVCAMIGTLSISPDRSQFFQMDEFTVLCPSDSWTVYRNTSYRPTPKPCAPPWGTPRESGCIVDELLTSDTGLYWCQNKEQECSPAASITVTDKSVILESPLFPVTEGEQVTLNCSYKHEDDIKPTSNFEAIFFKNNAFIGNSPNGKLVIPAVTKADAGLYKCEHPSKEQSLESRLIVKDRPQTPPTQARPPTPHRPIRITVPRLLCFVLLFILYTVILFIALSTYRKWAQARAEEKQQASERVSLRGIRSP